MKTLGLLGGMSWESTSTYYRLINESVRARLGGLHSARILLASLDFAEIAELQHRNEWAKLAAALGVAAIRLERAGADYLLVCTNTMHRVADEIQAAVSIPLLHIADATGERLIADGVRRVGLLGTRFTMQEPFYRERLRRKFGLQVVVPSAADQDFVHEVIYAELCLGRVEEISRRTYVRIIETLRAVGAEAVILGCTEIALLVDDTHTDVPLYDTTALHARHAAKLALETPRVV